MTTRFPNRPFKKLRVQSRPTSTYRRPPISRVSLIAYPATAFVELASRRPFFLDTISRQSTTRPNQRHCLNKIVMDRRKMPSDTHQAIRHICTVECDVTPILDIFCMPDGDHTFRSIQRNYRCLALLVHPDRVRHIEQSSGARYMQVVSRALEQAEYAARYAAMTGVPSVFHDASIPWTARFSRNPSPQEVFVNGEDMGEAGKR